LCNEEISRRHFRVGIRDERRCSGRRARTANLALT